MITTATTTPFVSVLMITRNHGPYVAQAITSVLTQRLEGAIELLIGEDASSDTTGSVCADYAARYPDTIRLLTAPEGALGMHGNFARLLAAARGRYLAFLEGDDYWIDEHKLARQIALLELSPSLSLCGTRTAIVERGTDGAWHAARELAPAHPQPFYTFAEMIPHYNFHFSSVVVRREAVDLPVWVAKQYCIDRPLYLLATRQGDAGFIDAVTSAYRQHAGGVWSGRGLRDKGEASRTLFRAFMEHFPAHYRPAFRHTLSGILWYYLSEARGSGDRDTGRALFTQALAAAPLHRLVRTPVGVASMALWLWAPRLDRKLRRLIRFSRR